MTVVFLLLALLFSASLMQLLGIDAASVLNQLLSVFTTRELLTAAILRSVPIGLAAVGLTVSFRSNFWNIGAEGQMFMGMFASTGVVLLHAYYGLVPGWALLPTMAVASFVAGGLYCSVAGVLSRSSASTRS